MAAGTEWTFTPPSTEPLAWMAISSGHLIGETPADAGEMVIFEQAAQSIKLKAGPTGDAVFVIAPQHPISMICTLGATPSTPLQIHWPGARPTLSACASSCLPLATDQTPAARSPSSRSEHHRVWLTIYNRTLLIASATMHQAD